MGRPKAYLQIGDRELLQRVLDAGREVCRDLLVVGDRSPRCPDALVRYGWEPVDGRDDDPGGTPGTRLFRRGDASLRVLPDRRPGRGPLAGLETGLDAARHPRCFVTGCDLPFLPPSLIARLLEELAAWAPSPHAEPAAVVVRVGGRLQPLCAAYARRAGEVAGRRLEEGRPRLVDFLEELRLRVLEPEDVAPDPECARTWLMDVDTPEALERARRVASRAGGA